MHGPSSHIDGDGLEEAGGTPWLAAERMRLSGRIVDAHGTTGCGSNIGTQEGNCASHCTPYEVQEERRADRG